MLVSIVVKLLVVVFMSFNFMAYAFAHGSCVAYESASQKCEVFKTPSICDQNQSSNTEADDEPNIHLCGCLNIFFPDQVQTLEEKKQPEGFQTAPTFFPVADYIHQIDRPPIDSQHLI